MRYFAPLSPTRPPTLRTPAHREPLTGAHPPAHTQSHTAETPQIFLRRHFSLARSLTLLLFRRRGSKCSHHRSASVASSLSEPSVHKAVSIGAKCRAIIGAKCRAIIGAKCQAIIGAKCQAIIGAKCQAIIGAIIVDIEQSLRPRDPEQGQMSAPKLRRSPRTTSAVNPLCVPTPQCLWSTALLYRYLQFSTACAISLRL